MLISHPGTEFTVLGAALLVMIICLPRGIAFETDRLGRRINVWMNATEPMAGEESRCPRRRDRADT